MILTCMFVCVCTAVVLYDETVADALCPTVPVLLRYLKIYLANDNHIYTVYRCYNPCYFTAVFELPFLGFRKTNFIHIIV